MTSTKCLLCRNSVSCSFISVHTNIGSGRNLKEIMKRIFPLDIFQELSSIEEICFKCSFYVTVTHLLLRSCDTFADKRRSLGGKCLLCDKTETTSFETCLYPGNIYFVAIQDFLRCKDPFAGTIKLCYKCHYHVECYIEFKTLIYFNLDEKWFNKDVFSSEETRIIRSISMKRKDVRGMKGEESSTAALHRIFHNTNAKRVASSTDSFSQKMRSLSVLVTDIRKDNFLQTQLGLENKGRDVWRLSSSLLKGATEYHMQRRTRKVVTAEEDEEVKSIETPKRGVKQVVKNNTSVDDKNQSASIIEQPVTRRGAKRKSTQSESSSVVEVTSNEDATENVVDTRDESQTDCDAMVASVLRRSGRGRPSVGTKRTNESVASVEVAVKQHARSRMRTRGQDKSPNKSKPDGVEERVNMATKEQTSAAEVDTTPAKQRKVSSSLSIAEGVRKSQRKLSSPLTLDSSGEMDINSKLHEKGCEVKVVESERLVGRTLSKRNSLNQPKEVETENVEVVPNLRIKRKSGKLNVGSVDEISPEKEQVQTIKAADDVTSQGESGQTRKVKSTKLSSFRRGEIQVVTEELVEAKDTQNVDASPITVEVPDSRKARRRSKKIQIEWCSFCGIQLDSVDNRLEHEFSHQEPRQLHVSLHRCNLHGLSVKLPVYVNLEEVAALKSPQEDNCSSSGNDTRPPLKVENVLNEDEYNAYDDASGSEEENQESSTRKPSQENDAPETLNGSETKETSAVVPDEDENKRSHASRTRKAKKKVHVKMRLWENVTHRTTRCGRVVKVTKKYEEHTLRSTKPCRLEGRGRSLPTGNDALDSVVTSPPEEDVDDYVEVIFPKENVEKVVDGSEYIKTELVSCEANLETSQETHSDLLSERPDGVDTSEVEGDNTSSCVEDNIARDVVNDEVPQVLEEPQVMDTLDDDEVGNESKVLEHESDDAKDASLDANADSDEIGSDVDTRVTTDLEDISENFGSKLKEDDNEMEINYEEGVSENVMDSETNEVVDRSDGLENPQEEDDTENVDADTNENDTNGLKCVDLEDSLENVNAKSDKDVELQRAILEEDSESMNLALNEGENNVDGREVSTNETGLEDISDGEFEYIDDEEMVNKVDEDLDRGRDEAENDGAIEFHMALDSVEAVFAEESGDKPESVEVISISDEDASEDVKEVESDEEESKEEAGSGEVDDDIQERDAEVECLESSENIMGCEDVADKNDILEEVEDLESSGKDGEREGLDPELGESEEIALVEAEMEDGLCKEIVEAETKFNDNKEDEVIGYTAEEMESSERINEEMIDVENKSPCLDEPSPVDKLDSVMLGNEAECSVVDKQCEELMEDTSGSSNNGNGLVSEGIDVNEGYDSCAINGISDVINESLPFEDVSVVRSIDRYEDGKDKTVIECETVRDFDDEKATMVCCK